jgi:N-acetylglucosaminyldiphosphoundecaprenol N-acetyl-beta-D-mannosaminyltransferase
MLEKNCNIFGIQYCPTDYLEASKTIVEQGRQNRSYGVTALAVHGLIASYRSQTLKDLVNSIDLVVPDGQPIRWAINSFYNAGLKDRVYGPTLTLHVLKLANIERLKVYLYGSTDDTLQKFASYIQTNYPRIMLCGIHIDRFRDASPQEDAEDIKKINESGAHVVLVGRGCPRQEIWVANHLGKINAAMMAVGAAFDFHAGTVKQAPRWVQDNGLEWLYRLVQEPRRLWKRYLITNSYFIYLFILHKYIIRRPY